MLLKQLKLLVLIFLFGSQAWSQQLGSTITILGHIDVDYRDTSYTNFKISLYEKRDSIISFTYADSNRNYVLIIPREKVNGKNLSLMVRDFPPKIDESLQKKSYCHIYPPKQKYLSDHKFIKSTRIDSNTYINCDWELRRLHYEFSFPCVQFKENTLEMLNCSGENPDSVLKCMAEILQENPKLVMEISAHADNKEKDQKCITEFRGEMIKNILFVLGINPNRLVVKSNGAERLLISEKQINSLASEEEKNTARQRNRRVLFSVLRKDFGE